jgi:hypothetical protein
MSTNNWTFIIAAYTVAWLGIAAYWIFVHRAIRRARDAYDRAIVAAAKTPGSR